jgi:hypothetical protein
MDTMVVAAPTYVFFMNAQRHTIMRQGLYHPAYPSRRADRRHSRIDLTIIAATQKRTLHGVDNAAHHTTQFVRGPRTNLVLTYQDQQCGSNCSFQLAVNRAEWSG